MNDYKKLCEENIKLVPFMIKKLNLMNRYEDLIDVGYIGLVKGCKSYNSSRGELSTYLCKCIQNEFFATLRNEKSFKSRTLNNSISLNLPIDLGGYELIDCIQDSYDLEEDVINKMSTVDLQELLKDVLTKREHEIICSLYGINHAKYTSTELAKMNKCTKSNINGIKFVAIKKLRKAIKRRLFV